MQHFSSFPRFKTLGLMMSLGMLSTAAFVTDSMGMDFGPRPNQPTLQKAVEIALKNGAPLHHAKDISLPRVSLVILFKGGPGLLPREKQGVLGLNQIIFEQGPASMSQQDYQHKLFLLQSEIGFSTQPRATSISITAPADKLREAVQLAIRVLDHPKYQDDEFTSAKERTTSLLKASYENLRGVISYLAPRHAFNWHPDTLDGSTSLKSLPGVTLQDLTSTKAQLFNFKHAFAVSTGPVDAATIKNILDDVVLDAHGTTTYEDLALATIDPAVYQTPETRVVIVHKDGVPDNQIFFLYPEKIPFDTPDRVAGLIAHDVLGGGLNSRLMKALRSERGLTYGVGSSLSAKLPMWVCRTFGTINSVNALVQGSQDLIREFRSSGPTPVEFSESQKQLEVGFRESIEMPGDLLSMTIKQALYHHKPEYFETFLSSLDKTSLKDVQTFAQDKLQTQGGFLFLMGNSKDLLPAVKDLGYPEKNITVMNLLDIP